MAIQGLAASREPHAGSLAAEMLLEEATFMRKIINMLIAGVMLTGVGIALPGCTDETGAKQETKITGPDGTTTETRQIKVDKSGKNPPAAPSENKNP